MTARAGWFPDPAGHPDHYRWWDGSAWTRLLTTDPAAAGPGPDVPASATEADPASAPDSQGADQPGRHQASEPTPWQPAGAVVATQAPADRRARPPGYERPDGAPGISWKPALIGVGVVLLAALVVLAIVLFGNPAPVILQPPPPADDNPILPSPTTSPTTSPTSSPTAKGLSDYDPTTRVFSGDGLLITLPGKPYTISSSVITDMSGPKPVGVLAFAPVHKHYDTKGDEWDAAIEVGPVSSNLAGKSLNQTADKIVSFWANDSFNGALVKIENEKQSTITKGEPRPARIITADLHYSIKGVASKYDHFSLLVIKGPSGNYEEFLSSRPNDASTKITKVLQASINTVRLT